MKRLALALAMLAGPAHAVEPGSLFDSPANWTPKTWAAACAVCGPYSACRPTLKDVCASRDRLIKDMTGQPADPVVPPAVEAADRARGRAVAVAPANVAKCTDDPLWKELWADEPPGSCNRAAEEVKCYNAGLERAGQQECFALQAERLSHQHRLR
jgi:hypothetical protein